MNPLRDICQIGFKAINGKLLLCQFLLVIIPSISLAQDEAIWPQFRGPNADGISTATDVPVEWSEEKNITWKIAVPGLGWSSPSIVGNEIWLTTAIDDGTSLRVLCYDRTTGKEIHNVEVIRLEEEGRIHKKNSHASPTPYIDGDRVFVQYGAYGTGCVSRKGKVLWTNTELKYKHNHGPGGSPVVYEDLLIVNCDGIDIQFIVAFDKKTGKIVWKQDRLHIAEARVSGKKIGGMAFSTPLLSEHNGVTQLISTGADHVAGYNPKTGEELWWSEYDGYSLVPRPVVGHGMVFVCSGFGRPLVYAIELGGKGNVTESHVKWEMQKGAPHSPSPILIGKELYVISDGGVGTCVDAKSGEIHWQERVGGKYSASPVYADGNIYLLDENGKTTVIKAAKEYSVVAESQLEGKTLSSISIAEKALFLRTDTHLYRIEKK